MDDSEWPLFNFIHKNLVAKKSEKIENTACKFCSASDADADLDEEHVVLVDGNYTCSACNCIIGRYIDQGAEWRYFGAEDSKGSDPTRCGLPTNELLPDSSLGSMIGYTFNESYEVRIMRKYHMWNCMSYKERSLYNIFETLTINAVNNGIPKSIIEEAKNLYKKISEARISRGDNRSGLIASSIYVSCKNNKVPRSAKEIAKIFNLKTTTLTRGCKRFQDIMKVNLESTMADDFINRFCSKLNVDNEKKDIIRRVVKIVEDLSLVSENTPPSIVTGCIYLCNIVFSWNMCKKELAAACDISQVTVSKCYKKLTGFTDVIFPPQQQSVPT